MPSRACASAATSVKFTDDGFSEYKKPTGHVDTFNTMAKTSLDQSEGPPESAAFVDGANLPCYRPLRTLRR
jgi:hypothetical protein